MSKSKKIFLLFCVLSTVVGCASVNQQDLDAWIGQPVDELDTHSLFITLPMVKTVTDNGIEIRDYVNKRAISTCTNSSFGNASTYGSTQQTLSYANFNAFPNCSAKKIGCDNIFYIKNKKIIEYKPVGRCYTDKSLQPEHHNF